MDARPIVDRIMERALAERASDVHLEPTPVGVEVRFRIDGQLQTVETLSIDDGRGAITRLMVLGELLTYRLDIPQEGRVRLPLNAAHGALDLRLAVIPTTHGLRAAVRLPADITAARTLETLALPPGPLALLQSFVSADAGMLIVTGPAGAGKTTTLYALLSAIAAKQPGLSIVTLEDPVERHVSGVTQIEVSRFGEMTYELALRSILRQDPQVLMLGEIRDAATASLAVQAALSGHRLACTLHAATPAGAIARLVEMGLEPYQLTSALFGVIAQRLILRSGGAGRIPLAEAVRIDSAVRSAILQRADVTALEASYTAQNGYTSITELSRQYQTQGLLPVV